MHAHHRHPELPLGKGGSGLCEHPSVDACWLDDPLRPAVSTATDYLHLLAVLINGGRGANGVQILQPETVEQMSE